MKTVLIPWILNFSDNQNVDRIIPLGLMSISSYLKEQGYESKIVDLNLVNETSISSNVNLLLQENAQVYGFSIAAGTMHTALQIAKKLKEADKNCVIVFGGPQATLNHYNLLKYFDFIDIVIRGEGEITFADLIASLYQGNTNLLDIKGITWRDKDDNIIVNEERPLICDLDTLPIPDYAAYDFNSLKIDVVPLEVGRGCPYSCSFCSSSTLWKRKYRVKSAKRIIDEMRFLSLTYDVKLIYFRHDQIILNRNWFIDLCREIKKADLGVKWQCSARIDTLDDILLSEMAESGCIGIECGIETLSNRMQKTINKNLNAELIDQNLRLVVQHNINPVLFFMCGFPDEDETELQYTLNGILKLISSCSNPTFFQLRVLQPFPYTKIRDENDKDLIYYPKRLKTQVLQGYPERLQQIAKNDSALFPEMYYIKNKHGISLEEFLNVEKNFNSFIRFLNSHFFLTFKYLMYHCNWDYKKIFSKLGIDKYCNYSENELIEAFVHALDELPQEIHQIYSYEKKINEVKNDWIFEKRFPFEKDRRYCLSSNVKKVEYSIEINALIQRLRNNDFSLSGLEKKSIMLIYAENKYTVKTFKINDYVWQFIKNIDSMEDDDYLSNIDTIKYLVNKGVLT